MLSPVSAPRRDSEESRILLPAGGQACEELSVEDDGTQDGGMTKSQAFNLYTSHLLSTWNARTYEFAAVIFTAAAYPDTLAASAIRGLVTTFASICVSSSLGRWIDHAPNRLTTLLTTITSNRLSVIVACVSWIFIVDGHGSDPLDSSTPATDDMAPSGVLKHVMFMFVIVLGILEKLSGSANMMSMERDWVVTVAAPNGRQYDLTRLNSVMRRIDLICKLVAPLLISVVISTTESTRFGVMVVGGMSAASWALEWWCARRVWHQNANLRKPKIIPCPSIDQFHPEQSTPTQGNYGSGALKPVSLWFHRFIQDFSTYFTSDVWVPSMALSLLHLSVLSYSATFITYLLGIGFSLNLITMARAAGSIVEISSTVVTPLGVTYLGKSRHHRHDRSGNDVELEVPLVDELQDDTCNTETGLERLGLWGITWQLINLIPVVLALWALSPVDPASGTSLFRRIIESTTSLGSPAILTFTLFTFLSLSRLGLWIFDLTTQQLSQTLVQPHQRSSFAGVERSFVNVFEFCHYTAVIVLSQPDQFRYLAIGSLATVGISTAMYAGWVWRQRGHLVHWEKVVKGCE